MSNFGWKVCRPSVIFKRRSPMLQAPDSSVVNIYVCLGCFTYGFTPQRLRKAFIPPTPGLRFQAGCSALEVTGPSLRAAVLFGSDASRDFGGPILA